MTLGTWVCRGCSGAVKLKPCPSFQHLSLPNLAEPQMWQDQAPFLLDSETPTPDLGHLQSHLLNTLHVPGVFILLASESFQGLILCIEKQTHRGGGVECKIPVNF